MLHNFRKAITPAATGKDICWIFYMHVNIILKITDVIPSALDCTFFPAFLDFYFIVFWVLFP